jgi:hypothetical protein
MAKNEILRFFWQKLSDLDKSKTHVRGIGFYVDIAYVWAPKLIFGDFEKSQFGFFFGRMGPKPSNKKNKVTQGSCAL